MLSNRYFIALVVPLLLLGAGALAKKLVRGTTWERTDFYLGLEATLAALSSGLIHLFELAAPAAAVPQTGQVTQESTSGLVLTISFVAVAFFCLLWVMSTHQDWEKSTVPRGKQILRLGVLANCVGLGLIAAYVIMIKGVH